MKALTTNHFTQCHLTNHLPKDRFGLQLSYEYLFAEFKQLLAQCLTKKPEIIFDQSGRRRLKLLEQNGYKVVYFHLGQIHTGSCWIRNTSWTGFYIAVREDLFNIVGDLGPHTYKKHDFYRWPKVQCQID